MNKRDMTGYGSWVACLALSCALVLAAGSAAAQSAGSIAGDARDSTGGVLPGVTVEAASPALIEGSKIAVTDAQGSYRIVDLRPGAYTVTFTLPGFSTFRREGIELTTGFTATVDAEMAVGAVEETVTVTGASPLVDIQNTRVQTVLSSETIDALPINKTVSGFAAVTLGASVRISGGYDVGGSKGEASAEINTRGLVGRQMKKNVDGMNYNTASADGGGMVSIHDVNQASMQETVIESAANAEHEAGGIQLNYVPKDGGNQFSVYAAANFTNEDLTQAGLTDELLAAGLTRSQSVKKVYDSSFGFGGPLVRDRAWFYLAGRMSEAQEYQPGTFWNKRINTPFYEPDLDAGLVWSFYPANDITGRVVWQAGEKHRVSVSDAFQDSCLCRRANSRTSPEAASHIWSPWGTQLLQATWTYTASNQLLFQAGASFGLYPLDAFPMPALDGQPGTDEATAINIFDSGLGVSYGAVNRGGPLNSYGRGHRLDNNFNQRFSVSYVTGTHSFKVGVQHVRKTQVAEVYLLNDISYLFTNQVPVRLTLWNSPLELDIRLRNVGFYAQDQWTIDRLTLNLGLRFDHFNGMNAGGSQEARRYVPAFAWNDVTGVPDFNDVSPRLGAAYDVFGDGRTAIKASFGRYVQSIGTSPYTFAAHPLNTVGASTNRTWNDRNGNFVPDCDQTNPAANGECGKFSNSTFGTTRPTTNFFLDDATQGFGNRAYNWQTNLSLTHELVPGVALSASYWRTWNGNFLARDNTFVTPADYDEYCVTRPTDARLPQSGQELCGLFDVDPALFGQVRTEITQMGNFGEQKQVYNGLDLSVNARFLQGGFLQGGVSFGRTSTNTCNAVVDQPAPETGYCDVVPPWSAGSQVKLSGAYPLWWGIQPSFTYQNLPGATFGANLRYTNAQIGPSLGRNLAAGSKGTVNIPIVEPQTLFLDRISQLDVRVTKLFELGRGRFRAMLDVYNLLAARTILGVSSTFGSSWQRPTGAMPGRLFKIGGTFEF